MRGKNSTDREFAPIGSTETTEFPKQYLWKVLRNGKRLYLVDLPGCGTTTFPTASYCKRFHLVAYDCLLLFCSGRVPTDIMRIAKTIQRYGRLKYSRTLFRGARPHLFFVRNRISLDIANAQHDGISAKKVVCDARAELRREISADLLAPGKTPGSRAFVIDSRELKKHVLKKPTNLTKLSDSLALLEAIEGVLSA